MATSVVMDDPVIREPGMAQARVAQVREFGQFWAREVVSWLDDGLATSSYSPTEAKVIFDLGRWGRTELGWLRVSCGIEVARLVRIVQRLRADDLVTIVPVPGPGGPVVDLTSRGQQLLATLDSQVAEQAGGVLAGLREDRQRDVLAAMALIRRALCGAPGRPFGLREPRPGDLGWVIQRHGAVYAQEYGWDERFEGEVAAVVARFAAERDGARERAWIAEVDEAPAGCAFCLRDARDLTAAPGGPATAPPAPGAGGAAGVEAAGEGRGPISRRDDARLSLLLVDPAARGLGVGRRLVGECVAFARTAGYGRLLVHTEDRFVSARRIFEAAGFHLVDERSHQRFGRTLTGQEWARTLDPVRRPCP